MACRKHFLLAVFCLILTLALQAQPPVTGTWVQTSPMAEARAGAAAALMPDGRVLLSGGAGTNGPLASVEIYANGSWLAAAAMATPRSEHQSVTLADGRVLVIGGKATGGKPTWTAEVYDPAHDRWSSVGGMANPRVGHTVTLLADGKVVVTGGFTGATVTDAIEIFDPATEKFSVGGLLSSPRTDHAAALLADGRLLIAGGSDGNAALSSAGLFDPVTGKVTRTAELSMARVGLSATTQVNGTVLLAGGNNGTTDLSSAEIYDPAAGTFTPAKGGLANARRDHLAFLLPHNNSVLIVGGTSAGKPTEGVGLFKPSLGTAGLVERLVSRLKFWTSSFGPTGSLLQPRSAAAGSVLLDDGRLLIAGGSGGATAEIYTFATVKTDRESYSAGDTVTITGSNWQAGETVSVRLQEDPKLHEDRTIKVVADESGNIHSELKLEDLEGNLHVYVAANGASSQAQVRFATPTARTNLTLVTTADTGFKSPAALAPKALAETAPPLGAAGSFSVLGASTVTNTGPTIVTGDLGVSPGTAVTGFPPGTLVGGLIHAADALAAQAQNDATTAYNNLAAQACTTTYPAVTDLGGQTLLPGVYCFASSAAVTGTLTLNANGNPNAVFVFKTGSTFITASGASVLVTNGGQNCNVFWQVGSSATLGTTSTVPGTIIALASITLNTGASVSGRAIARTAAVTLDSNNVRGCPTPNLGAASISGGGGGLFPPDTTFNGLPITALEFGYGLAIGDTGSAIGQFYTVLLGIPVGGVQQRIVIEGIVSSASRTAENASTYSGIVTVNGAGGVPFTATVVTDANDQGTLGLVIGGTTLPTAALNEGSQTIK